MSQLCINFIHVINFSNIQNALSISVMHALQAILYQAHCKILRVPPVFLSFLHS